MRSVTITHEEEDCTLGKSYMQIHQALLDPSWYPREHLEINHQNAMQQLKGRKTAEIRASKQLVIITQQYRLEMLRLLTNKKKRFWGRKKGEGENYPNQWLINIVDIVCNRGNSCHSDVGWISSGSGEKREDNLAISTTMCT